MVIFLWDVRDVELEMPARVKFVLLFEGTWNHEGKPSAMTHLFDMLQDTRTQRKHIVSGSGTYGWILQRLLGGLGHDSYVILLRQYQWLTGQVLRMGLEQNAIKVYLFGFSRGAYQARMFCDLLTHFGIPSKVDECKTIVSCYRQCNSRLQRRYRPSVNTWVGNVRYVGFIDPVRGLIPGFINKYCLPLDDTIAGRCAYSISERRRAFYPQLNNGRRVKSEWFAGVHSDVGWAYEDSKTLGKIALRWVLEPVEDELDFIYELNKFPSNVSEAIQLVSCSHFVHHNSFTAKWWLAGLKKRRVCCRNRIVRALDIAMRRTRTQAPKPFRIWPFSTKMFRAINKRRVVVAVKEFLQQRGIVDKVFRRLKVY